MDERTVVVVEKVYQIKKLITPSDDSAPSKFVLEGLSFGKEDSVHTYAQVIRQTDLNENGLICINSDTEIRNITFLINCGIDFEEALIEVGSELILILEHVEVLRLTEEEGGMSDDIFSPENVFFSFTIAFYVYMTDVLFDTFEFFVVPFEFNNNGEFILNECVFRNLSTIFNSALINSSNLKLFISDCSFIDINSNTTECKGGAVYFYLVNGGIFEVSGRTRFENCTAGKKSSEDVYDGWGGGIYLKIADDFLKTQSSYFLFTGEISFSNCNARYGKNIFIESENLSTIIITDAFDYVYEKNIGELYLLMGKEGSEEELVFPLLRYLIPDLCLAAYPEFTCSSGCCRSDSLCMSCNNETECEMFEVSNCFPPCIRYAENY
jgi:hypothetical protein